MNPEIKDRWVAALRSGEYEQGRRVLRYNDKYCCLGVLCELAVADGVIASEQDRGEWVYFDPEATDDASRSALPTAVMQWADIPLQLSDEVQIGSDSGGPTYLSTINDLGDSFSTIARVIEEQL